MAEIIYFKDVLLIKPQEEVSIKKRTRRSRLKPMKEDKLLKSSLVERKKEDLTRK